LQKNVSLRATWDHHQNMWLISVLAGRFPRGVRWAA